MKQIHIVYKEHTIHNIQKKYQGVICTQRHDTMKMVKVMYNDQLVYKVDIWAFFGISLWTEKVALSLQISCKNIDGIECV